MNVNDTLYAENHEVMKIDENDESILQEQPLNMPVARVPKLR